MRYIGKSKEQLAQMETTDIKKQVEKDSWIALKQYFDGRGNGPEAKIAVVVVGTLAKEDATKNNARQLDLVEMRLRQDGKLPEKK